MKTVIICPDQFNKSTWSMAEVEDLSAYLAQQFTFFPPNARIYHNAVAESNDVTPQNEAGVKHLQTLEGTFYVVIHPEWIQFIYYAIVAIMAAYSIYTILTMPKPDGGQAGSANNELSNRSNRMRVKGRIPDIYGMVRAYPDLIAVIYSYYLNDIEIEECLMCIGRGYYQIHDCRDGDTDVTGIDGVSVSIYDPDVSIIGAETTYKVGESFTALPLDVAKSTSINGQSLVEPNDVVVESRNIYFTTGGVIHSSESSNDFRNVFNVGDGLAISRAHFGIDNAVLSGSCTITADYKVRIESTIDVAAFADYKGILLNGANVVITTTDPVTGIESDNNYDLSGQYIVSSVTRSLSGSTYTYVVQLDSPKQVNYNWNFVDDDYNITAGITLNNNIGSVDLDDNYSVIAVTASSITLANASTVNSDWDKIPILFNGSTQGLNDDLLYLELVANKWVGWFELYHDAATALQLNVYFPQGLYNVNKDGKTVWNDVTITVQYQSIDDSGNPVGAVQSSSFKVENKSKSSFGRTFYIDLATTGNQRFRLAKTQAGSGANPVTECKVKDVYLTKPLDKAFYPDVTIVRSRTVATDGALSVKERMLNSRVTRKLPVDGTGLLVATRDAGQALINMGLDPYVGRRSVTELDIAQIKSEIQSVKDYFGSPVAAEFCYTFDDENLSFEEQAGMIASACFCESLRFGNKLRLKFEKPQQNSVLLFNHRNKVMGSETRTWKFGIDKDYDGVEIEYTSPLDDKRVTYSIPPSVNLKNPLKITTSGIRNEAVAKTRAWREWNKLQFQNVNCEFTALDESELLIRNDRILVADNTNLETQDGEIEAIDGLILTCSQDVIFEAGAQYFCHLQLDDATVDIVECVAGAEPYEINLIRPPLRPLVVDPDRYVKTLYTVIKAADSAKDVFMLSEMSPNDQMTNKLTCINYDDRYYQNDHDFI
ncbi:host specificity factor TipJ family phage tail protein [Acinetobacter higginsii]|uniref:host specificity factor TipJ family phage tail protein n=1 Tax=Acinetobacter higginsii TaxID=70347 RepID=UPI001F4AA681|nr:host specificity factor TipJ family phage tail protein [Acinetobacter higginsii]MCH7381186.1 host specificity factor TipJ family phage tail protein [Acinetobacter higginsii]